MRVFSRLDTNQPVQVQMLARERGGSVVERWTPEREVGTSTVLCS